MAEKKEKEVKTASSKLNTVLEKNRKLVISCFVAVIAAVAVFIIVEIAASKAKDKNLAAIEALTYELVNDSSSLEEAELTARRDSTLEKVEKYTKKGGVAGVRANMLAAELAYQKKDYEAALAYWDAAAVKSKKSYTAPLANYNKAVCYEQLGKLDEAADAYKAAVDVEDFVLRTHAMFSYGRILETKGQYAEAVKVYQELNDKNPSDTWANLAKTRIIDLKVEGKAE